MSENVLKKEFSKKDVTRLRNLVNNKHNEATTTQAGYKKSTEFHSEGDIWEENGKMWTIKEGIKQNITKLDTLKHIAHTPLFCPQCSKLMKGQVDKKMYNIHKKCLDCVSLYESKLRLNNEYEAYEKNIIKNNALGYLDDFEQEFIEFVNEKLTFVTEAGDVENWGQNVNREQLIEDFNQYKANLKNQIDKI
jgi:hypothetical protein